MGLIYLLITCIKSLVSNDLKSGGSFKKYSRPFRANSSGYVPIRVCELSDMDEGGRYRCLP